uniref:Protein SCAR n=1 Tax=Cajanus cajan TaxID=3821 RepID=A0A151RT59_CAJCA|nr:Protein SCAR3 [Cajanus cajan]
MPLVRLQMRNEFGLGQPELYRETNREDPKAVLDGVAVAGLVGILRQLGDLADFAADVFHGLQEQVMTTASRSHRLMVRVQNIEAALPALEKAVLAQTSHIHLAYTAGCEWHPRIKPARNHFIYNDLPHFIMDSYEECRDPPRVHLLDKFDTGGPGSCYRRYSDPTFFKRSSADLDESYSEKTEKARKSRKSKKKRSSRRNGESLRGEQMHSSSGRMQSISSTINGRTSSSRTASTIDMTLKSDREHYSNSFDSKSGAGYIECIFHPSNSMQSDEPDYKEPSSPRLTQKTDTLPSVSPLIDDSISHNSLEKKVASSSSGVTWDEKEEIVESKSQICDRDKAPERLVEKHDSNMHANEAVTLTNIDYNHILFKEESNLKPVSNRVQIDDIDSEPDNYEDALNTIESESENDIDYITKREKEYTVPSNKETAKDLADSLEENHVLDLVSKPDTSNLEIAKNIAESHPSKTPTCKQVPHSHGNSVLDHSVCTDTFIGSSAVTDTLSAPIETDVSFSGSKSTNLPNEEAGKINRYDETRRESLADHPVRFWTNGGLLGLEPSKPPDFSKSTSLSQGSMSTKSHNDDQACISEKTTGSSQLSNGFGQTERSSLGDIRVTAPGSVLPAAPDKKDNTESNQGDGENASRVFGLSRRLLINSFQRKVSFDEKSGHYNSLKSVILEQSEQNSTVGQSLPETTTFKEKVGFGYPIKSLPPSPPLEHMKISFQPVSGLETSKLKLKFPDGSNRHESIKEMFPSFQLVPEPSVPGDDSVSHSDDDDTFCRSSPYISDDCRSPRSDYNSDQWESDESPESSDQGVHDSPDRSYDNVNPALEKESKKHSKCTNAVMSHSHAEATPPPPPPLPPTQWRVSKPELLDMTNGTQHCMSEDAEHINDLSLPDSTIFQQPSLTQVEQIQINHDGHVSYDNIIYKLKDKLDQQKLKGQKEANQLRMEKETDEREDFLYQIRTKAFNLRPTITGKSNDATGPTANVKVTAILEKANAIRQVVASDDGEDDDNWSDT